MLTLELFEDYKEPTLIDALRDFLPIAVDHLKLKAIPKITFVQDVKNSHVPTFGRFTNDTKKLFVDIENRHPNDIIRTLAHELTHFAQGEANQLSDNSWETGSPVENDANAQAGVMMRKFNTKFPQYLKLSPVIFEDWSKKYKDSINCSNPKGFSQKAHCAGRKKNTNEAEDKCPPATQDIALNLKNRQKAINEYGYGPLNPLEPNRKFWAKKQDMWQLDSIEDAKKSLCGNCAAFDVSKDAIACIERGIGDDSGSENPHDVVEAGNLGYCRFLKFKCASLRTCDAWVVGGPITENFADGKGPGRAGDSQRHGIPKGATISQLEKAAKAPGRKGQLARWQINMRRGKKK
jgi:hypothetical protein